MLQDRYKAWKADFECFKAGFVLPGGILILVFVTKSPGIMLVPQFNSGIL